MMQQSKSWLAIPLQLVASGRFKEANEMAEKAFKAHKGKGNRSLMNKNFSAKE